MVFMLLASVGLPVGERVEAMPDGNKFAIGTPVSGLTGNPSAVVADSQGNLYIAEPNNHRVLKVNEADGAITTVAGTGTAGNGEIAEGTLGTETALRTPTGLALDSLGNLYISDRDNWRVLKLDSSGIIHQVAHLGLHSPEALKFDDRTGNLYIVNQGDKRIKMVDASGNLTTVAGNGGTGNYGEGQPATSVPLYNPVDVAIDSQGNLYISDQHRIRKVDTAGKAWSYAGGQEGTNSNQKLSQLQFRNIGGLAIDSAGNMYVADSGNHRIIVIDLVTTSEYNNMNFAGTTGQKGTWDAPLTLTTLDTPKLISVDHKGDLYIPDPQNQLIRSIQTGYMLTYDINGGSGTAPRTVFLKYI